MIVDDDPLVRTFARDVIEDAGYHVAEAADVTEALRELERDGFSVVITDIEMPGPSNGIDLAWAVRSRWPHVNVIIMSGCRLPLPRDIPDQVVMLTKPFTGQRLIDVLLVSTRY